MLAVDVLFLALFPYGGIMALVLLGAYYLMRFLSGPLAKGISKFHLVNEIKSVSRLVPNQSL